MLVGKLTFLFFCVTVNSKTKNCYQCESACSANAGMAICMNEVESGGQISITCKKKLACCYGNTYIDQGVDITILEHQTCLGVCQTKFTEQPSLESSSVKRRCGFSNDEKFGIFYGSNKLRKHKFPRLPVLGCEQSEEGCISLCNCKGDLCNTASEIGDCISDWSFTATFLWYFMWVLIAVIIFGEFMWHFGLNCKLCWIENFRPFSDNYILRRVDKKEELEHRIVSNPQITYRRPQQDSIFDSDV